MVKRILLIINPKAGRAKATKKVRDIVSLLQRYSYAVTVYFTDKEKFSDDIDMLLGDSYAYIICVGGDGTLSLLIDKMKKNDIDIPIMYVSSGTTNDFGRTINLNKNILDNINEFKKVKIHTHDIANVNNKFYFNYVLAVGALVDASSKTSRFAKNMFGSLSYIFRAIKEVKNIRSFRCKIDVDGTIIDDKFALVMVTNSKYVGSFKLPDIDSVVLNDGMYEVYLCKMPKKFSTWTSILKNLMKHSHPDYMQILRGKNINIEFFDDELASTIDGENIELDKKLNIKVINKGIKFLY